MKSLITAVALGASITTSFATVPKTLDNQLLYITPTVLNRATGCDAYLLKADGSFTRLFTLAFIRGSPVSSPGANTGPQHGLWSYAPLSEMAAELTLEGYAEETFRMEFSGEKVGFLMSEDRGRNSGFRIAGESERHILLNTSNLCHVSPGSAATAGFVIGGQEWRPLLIRAAGPALKQFGVLDPLPSPQLVLQGTSSSMALANSAQWTESDEDVQRVSSLVGAFPFPEASTDAAIIVVLPPGAYVAQVKSTDPQASGQVLIEAYILP